jgi:hypothetical protein
MRTFLLAVVTALTIAVFGGVLLMHVRSLVPHQSVG